MSEELSFANDPDSHRFTATMGGQTVTEIDYTIDGDVATITSTVTPPEWQNQGFAGELTRYALDTFRENGTSVIPRCPYAATWIKHHPEYADMLADEQGD